MASPPRIPPELYRLILEYISDKPTLRNLCLSFKTIQSEAERRLYRKLTLDSTLVNVLLLKTILHNGRLAAMVEEYQSWCIIRGKEGSNWDLLKSGLHKMVNLKVLDFLSTGGGPCAELILHAPFQLEKLVWRCCSDEEVLREILVEQQSLKVLYLPEYSARAGNFLTAEACPNLITLAGSCYAIEDILPGRSEVREVGWGQRRGIFSISDDFLAAKAFSSVKLLSFGLNESRLSLRSIGAQNLKELEVLQLFGLYPEEELVLYELLSLRELVISEGFSSRSGSLRHNLTLEQCEKLAHRLFAGNAGLQSNIEQVDIFWSSTPKRLAGYYRWRRDFPSKEFRTQSEVQLRFAHLTKGM